MFVPFVPATVVPFNKTTTVVNKTIVYSDTVLNLKDLGGSLTVTTIDVDEYDFEKCLKIIFESNKNVIFNTIQYSKSNKKVYFYTDKEISLKAWNDSKLFVPSPVTNKTEILEEVKRVLQNEKNYDLNIVNLNQVYKVMKKKRDELKYIVNNCEAAIDSSLRMLHCDDSYCVIYDFDYKNNSLGIGFTKYEGEKSKRVYLTKKDGDLCIDKSETLYAQDYLEEFGNIISELYDTFKKNACLEEFKYGIKPINSNFYVGISKYCIRIADEKILCNNFELAKSIRHKNFDYTCNSYSVISAIKGNEEELFKRIYINIKDCPKWMREELTVIRYNELKSEEEKERKIQEQKELEEFERKLNESKKQKRLELKRKIFPWLKK